MARRLFHVIDITEILVHWDAGRSQSEWLAARLDGKTMRKYLAPAVAAGMAPGGRQPGGLVRGWSGRGSRS